MFHSGGVRGRRDKAVVLPGVGPRTVPPIFKNHDEVLSCQCIVQDELIAEDR
jgi:hypothetical protein